MKALFNIFIGGAKSTKDSFPKRMIIDGHKIFNQGKIANWFNKFFVDLGPKLALMIPELQATFDQYLNRQKSSWVKQTLPMMK